MACKSKVPIKVSFRWAEWMFSIGLAIAVILWSAYVFGQNINVNLTDDYNRVQTSEQTLLQDSPKFQNGHLNFDADLDQPMGREIKDLREKAVNTIAALAGRCTPSNRIETAKHEYRVAL